jgi:hypothetical protein
MRQRGAGRTLFFNFFSRKEKRMENRFDDLTKALAEGIPRRQALRRLAGLFGGALLGSFAFSGKVWASNCPTGTIQCNGKCCPASITIVNPCPCIPEPCPPLVLTGCCLHGMGNCGFISISGTCVDLDPLNFKKGIVCSG